MGSQGAERETQMCRRDNLHGNVSRLAEKIQVKRAKTPTVSNRRLGFFFEYSVAEFERSSYMLVRGMLNIQQKVQPTKISIKKNPTSNVEIRLIICYNKNILM